MDPVLQERLLRGIAGYLAALTMTVALGLDAGLAYAIWLEVPSTYWWTAILLFSAASSFLHVMVARAEMTARGSI